MASSKTNVFPTAALALSLAFFTPRILSRQKKKNSKKTMRDVTAKAMIGTQNGIWGNKANIKATKAPTVNQIETKPSVLTSTMRDSKKIAPQTIIMTRYRVGIITNIE